MLVQSSWFLIAGLMAVVCAPLVDQLHPGLGFGRYLVGLLFAVLLYGSVLVHEASHAWMARRFGFRVTSISLNFLGGATLMDGESRTPRQEFWIAVVGPIASLGCAGAAWLAAGIPEQGSLAEFLVSTLAFANLLVGLTNLVPALPLDGGRVLVAGLWHTTGDQHRATVIAAWSGRVVAVLVLLWPFFSQVALGREPSTYTWVIHVVIAGFLWTAASAFLGNARLRAKLARLDARALARPAVAVSEETTLANALAQAHQAGAQALVTIGPDGAVSGVVSDRAVQSTPLDRRPWLAVRGVARTLDRGMVLPADITGETLLRAMTLVPAESYVLVERDGSLVGVLVTEDVDRAYAQVGH